MGYVELAKNPPCRKYECDTSLRGLFTGAGRRRLDAGRKRRRRGEERRPVERRSLAEALRHFGGKRSACSARRDSQKRRQVLSDSPHGHPWFAAVYDRLTARAERTLLGDWRRRLLADARGDVLEVGVGTGANLPIFHELTERGAALHLTLVEPDPHMLRRARRRARQTGVDVVFVQAAAEALPFADASFDTVIMALVLCSVQDPYAAVREAYRVLRPGGAFHFLEHVRSDGLRGRLQDLLTPLWSALAGGCQLNRDTRAVVETLPWQELRVERLAAPFPVSPVLLGRARRPLIDSA